MLSLHCIWLPICAEEENKETEATVEQERATGSHQMIPPQSMEASETVAVSQEEPNHLQMTTS